MNKKKTNTATLQPPVLSDSTEVLLDVGYHVQGQLLKWDAIVGMAGLRLARPCLDVAKDQLPSPRSLGAPTGKDICQRESWQLYFLFHLGLSLIHPSCSFLPFFSLFFLVSSRFKPTLCLLAVSFYPYFGTFFHCCLSLSPFYHYYYCLNWMTSFFPSLSFP